MSTVLAKGYPEFDPDQPRDEGGRFAGGGTASKPDRGPIRPMTRSAIEGEEQYVHRSAIGDYRSGAAEIVNMALREAKERGTNPERTFSKLILDVDAHIRGHRVTKDVMVYRGVDPDFAAVIEKMNPGDSFTDQGYTSTSAKISIANKFARGGAIFEIIVPAGSNIAPMQPDTGGFEVSSHEHEYLLPRNSTFVYVSKRMMDKLPIYRFEYNAPVGKFDPNQARDENGKWTSGGASAGATPDAPEPAREPSALDGALDTQPATEGVEEPKAEQPTELPAGFAYVGQGPSPEAKEAALFYSGGMGYALINQSLRSDRDSGNPMVEQTIKGLDDFIASTKLAQDTVVYRGTSLGMGETSWFNIFEDGMKPGDEFEDPGYLSTTYSADNARTYFRQATDVMEIKLPAGMTVGAMEQYSDAPGEKEILLPRNTKLRYVGPQQREGFAKPVQVYELVNVGKAFDPSQPRDEDGKWTDTGAGGRSASLDALHMSERGLIASLEDRLPDTRVSVFSETGGGKLIRLRGEGENLSTFKVDKVPVTNAKRMGVRLIVADDTPQGARWAQRVMGIIRDMSVASGAEFIEIEAGLDSGGYAWPRLGFVNADPNPSWLRSDIGRRVDVLAQAGAVTDAEAADIRQLLSAWAPDTPTKLSKLDRIVDVSNLDMVHVVKGATVRGKHTLGKLLLSGTTGKYRLPRAKFNAMGRIAKGYPEFNPDQPRDAEGQFSGGGGSALDMSSERALGTSIASRLNRNSIANVHEFGGGWDVQAGDGVNLVTFFIPKGAGKPLTFEQINTAADEGGRQFARNALAVVLAAAKQADASAIRLEAAGAGGFVWPFVGFGLDQGDAKDAAAAVAHWRNVSGVDERVARATKELSWSQGRELKALMKSGSLDLPAQLARLDFPITHEQMVRISGGDRYLALKPDAKPSLGKALLVGVRGNYSLPKSDWGKLERYIGRIAKGYPEFDPDQPRDAEGQFSSSGGGASSKSPHDVRGERYDRLQDSLTAQMPPGFGAYVDRSPSGAREIRFFQDASWEGGTKETAYAVFRVMPSGVLHADMMSAEDTPAGRAAAAVIMRALHRVALDSGVEKIYVEAGLEHGNWIWPRLGFELRSVKEVKDFAEHMQYMLTALLVGGVDGNSAIDDATYTKYGQMLRDASKVGDRSIATKIARLDDPPLASYTPNPNRPVRGRVTVSKLLMSHGRFNYVLPRAKFGILKALGTGMGKAFNPDQPRDELGRWTDGAPAAGSTPDLTRSNVKTTDYAEAAKDAVAARSYSSSHGYLINMRLRGDTENTKTLDARMAAEGMTFPELIERVDRFIANSEVVKAGTVYRVIAGDYVRDVVSTLKPGDQLSSEAYLSTSESPLAFPYGGGAMMQIEVPAGAKAAVYGDLNQWEEKEVLFPRGSVLEFMGKQSSTWAAHDLGVVARPSYRFRLVFPKKG